MGLPLPVQKAASYIAQKAVELDLAPGYVAIITILLFTVHVCKIIFAVYFVLLTDEIKIACETNGNITVI